MPPHIEEIFNASKRPEEANLPGYRLHTLTGDSQGLWSIRVTGNYRIVFGFDGEGFTKLDLVDYH